MSLLSSYPNYSNRVHIGWSSICVTAHLSLWNQQADNLCILSSYCSNAQEDGKEFQIPLLFQSLQFLTSLAEQKSPLFNQIYSCDRESALSEACSKK